MEHGQFSSRDAGQLSTVHRQTMDGQCWVGIAQCYDIFGDGSLDVQFGQRVELDRQQIE